MTLLPSFDPGTVPRAPLAGSGDRASSGQPGTGSGQAQGFAALVGQPPEAAPTLPESPPEGSAEASGGLPDVLAQLLRPLPASAPQGGGPQPLAAEAEATDTLPDGLAQILQPVPGTALQDGTAQSVFAEGAPLPDAATETEIGTATDAAGTGMLVEAASDLHGAPTLVAPHLPDAAQATTEDPPAAAENQQDGYGEGLAELGATGLADAHDAPAEPEPLGGVTSTTQSSAADKTFAEKSDTGKTGTARDAAELGRSAQGPDSAQPRIAPGPETVPAKPETIPALPPEVPRPVSLSVSLAPAPAPAQTAGPAAPPPLLSTAGADWPLDLAADLAASASLRSFANGGMMEIRLDPEALGHVTLRLEVTDGTANVAIVTQTPEAARLFTDNQHRLAEALARAGLDLGQHSAGTGSRDGQSGRERPTDAPAQPGPARSDATATPTQAGGALRDRRIDLIA